MDPLADGEPRDEPRDRAQNDLALDLAPFGEHLRRHVHRLLHRHRLAIDRTGWNGIRALVGRERGVVDPGDEPLGREPVGRGRVVGMDVAGDEREGEPDGNALRDLVRNPSVADDAENFAVVLVSRKLARWCGGDCLVDARALVRRALGERAQELGERLVVRNRQRLVVVPERLVRLAALFIDEPGEKAAEPEDRILRFLEVVLDVAMDHAEPASLHPRAAEIAGLEVVDHVERVDEKLLVGRGDVASGRSGEDVLADRVAGVVRQVEHVDRLVGRLKIALALFELGERLLNRSAVENQKGVIPPHLFGKIVVAAHAERSVHLFDRSSRPPGIERGAHGQRLELVAAATDRYDARDSRRDRRASREMPRRPHLSSLVTYALCCQRMAPV